MNFDQADALNEAIRAVGIRHRALAVAALAPMGIHPGHKLLLLELAAGPRTQASGSAIRIMRGHSGRSPVGERASCTTAR